MDPLERLGRSLERINVAQFIPRGPAWTLEIGRTDTHWLVNCGTCKRIILNADWLDFTLEDAWRSWVQHCLREHWRETSQEPRKMGAR